MARAATTKKPFRWAKANPEDNGLSAAKLDSWAKALANRRTSGLLLVRNDRIVLEWYSRAYSRGRRHYTASCDKAIVAALSLAVAGSDGRIGVDDLACKYIPAWRADKRKSKITIRQLGSHCSGIENAEQGGRQHWQLTGWKGAFWKRVPDPFTMARDCAPAIFAPGRRFHYSNTGIAMLGYAVTAAIRRTLHKDTRTLLAKRIYEPIGLRPGDWRIGYGETNEVDALKLVGNWGGGEFTARALARIGRLMLRRGDWQGRQIIDPAWVDELVSYAGTPIFKDPDAPVGLSCGLGWWNNASGRFGAVPRDAFYALGAGHQVLMVVPSLNLIMVRYGEVLTGRREKVYFQRGLEQHLFTPLMAAIVEPPQRPSDVIKRIDLAPVCSVVRKAAGCDNWPITWADDGHQYAAYGDGWGFKPYVKPKLSNGLAKIVGPPERFRGINIRSATGESIGDGKSGTKASGMLMVDGVLYMLMRNMDIARLACSADRGKTWQWAFSFTEGFGCPTFLNFGRNYAGARDRYVYVYSQDGPGAYHSYDQVALARVPKTRIADRQAYEFFAGLTRTTKPRWTKDIRKRKGVFLYPGHCRRLDVAYNAGIGRYLMALAFDHAGKWGIFDAPEPWGPWTTAYCDMTGEIPSLHSYRLPTKWISKDGLTMWLVFSGYHHLCPEWDAFCLRKMTVKLHELPATPSHRPSRSQHECDR